MKCLLIVFCFVVISVPFASAQSQNFTVGQIELPDRCYSPTQIGKARVIDPDMNTDREKIETVPVSLWSSRDLEKRTPLAIETGTDTGIFEVSVFFRVVDDASSQRIQAFEGDTLYAQYHDLTLPFATTGKYNITDTATVGRLQPNSWYGQDWADMSLQKNIKYVYDPCMAEFMNKIGKDDPRFDMIDIEYPTLLKQINSGLLPHEVVCKEGSFPVIRIDTESTVCLKSITHMKLIERGWKFTGIGIPDVYNIKDNTVE